MKRNGIIKKVALGVIVLLFVVMGVLLLVVATVNATQNPEINQEARNHAAPVYLAGFWLCIIFFAIAGAILLYLRKLIARKSALASREGFVEVLRQIEELEINSDVERETLEKSTDLKADLMLAIQLTPASKVDWVEERKETTLLEHRAFNLICAMSYEISSAEEARREASILMEELPGKISALEDKIKENKVFSAFPKAELFIREAKNQYAIAQTIIDDTRSLYTLLKKVQANYLKAEGSLSWLR